MLPIYLTTLLNLGMVAGVYASLWLAREIEGKKGMILVAIGIFIMITAIAVLPVML